jgi:hypothetical protein
MEELFGENSLHLCKYRLDNNEIPSLEKLADIIEANSDAPLPDWFVKHRAHVYAILTNLKKGDLGQISQIRQSKCSLH